MLKVTNIRVRSFDKDYLDIYWDVEPIYDDVLDYEFVIEKSTSQYGPFQDLTGAFRNKFHVRDNTVRGQRGYYNHSYYRVRVKHLPSGDEATFPEEGHGVKLDAAPDLHAIEMSRIENLKLREFKGRKVWVFPRKRFGQKCRCYDPVTRRKTVSQCQSCFDTGWVGGYDSPLQVWAQIISPDERTTRGPYGEHNHENTVCKLANYPEVMEGWIIVEGENIRWRVGSSLRKFRKGRSLIRQEVQLNRVEPSDIEYALPLNLSNIEDLVIAPPRNMTNPQTLVGANSITDAIEFYSGV